ncbi:hypothetical protein EJB05_03049, partial [Eragrostis curvula]
MLPSELLIFHQQQQQKLSLTPIEGRAASLDSWSQDMEDTADLLTPYKMGEFNLAHSLCDSYRTYVHLVFGVHICMAGLFLRRWSYENLAQPHNALYYEQRAAPGVLLIAEASAVSETATGYPHVPGLWSQEQVEAWKPVVEAVHAKGALFFCQLWHTGRKSPTTEFGAPTRMDPEEIPQMVMDFRVAARNAIRAGFDGVEIHAANGFLINQFWWFLDIGRVNSLQGISPFVSNPTVFRLYSNRDSQPLRLDQLTKDNQLNGGSSLDNACCRFATDVVAAVVDEVGAHRVGLRLSPFVGYTEADAQAHALHLVHFMDKLGVLYCHMVEPRKCINGDNNGVPHRLSLFRKAFRGTFIVNGGYDREEGDRVIRDGYADLVSYGRLFLANPDLPERFRKKAGLNKYDRSTFYTSDPVVGYTDYPFLGQETQVA